MALNSLVRSNNAVIQNLQLHSLEELRAFQSREDYDAVVLTRAVAGGLVVNEVFLKDPADTTSADDGYSCIVAADGARWKLPLDRGYNPLLLLGTPGYSSLNLCINKIALDLTVKWSDRKGVIDFCTTIRIPGNSSGSARYTMTGPVRLPSFVTLHMETTTYFDFSGNSDGLIIDNSLFPLLLDSTYSTDPTARPRSVLLWESERSILTGAKLNLNHPIDSARTSNAGITIGNTVSGYIDVRGCTVGNWGSYGFYYGIKINPVDSYINTFRDGHLGRNHYAVAVLGASKTNAGEKFVFDNLTLADSDSDLIYIENNAFELFFKGCSCDYSTGDMVKITKDGNAYVSFSQCHIEGIQGMLVNVVAANTYPKYGKRVVFSDCILDLGSGQPAPALWNKTWFFSTVINTYVYILESTRVWTSTSTMALAKTAYQSLIVTGKPANNQVVLDYRLGVEDLLDASSVLLGSFNPGGNNKRVISTGRYDGTPGDAYTTSVNTADAWGWYTVNGSWVFADADADDADGVKGITLTSTNASTKYYLICNLPEPVGFQDKFRALGAIKIESGYTGDVNVRCMAEVRGLTTMNSAAVADSVINTSEGADVNVSSVAEANSRIGKYQGFVTPALQVQSFNNQAKPMTYVRVGLILSGFTGTISLKLPTVTSHRRLTA
ncbi:hypothetical protein 6993_0053 [Klebsiella phage 6993]|uniref:Uncharacterized protein n=1 Tax=Klebsiella phage 6993 TaxID=2912297 RepID=A0A9E7SC24_9CAUD|nr:hypothetical protein 6993_0053 [Klebsiella phage 6993]